MALADDFGTGGRAPDEQLRRLDADVDHRPEAVRVGRTLGDVGGDLPVAIDVSVILTFT